MSGVSVPPPAPLPSGTPTTTPQTGVAAPGAAAPATPAQSTAPNASPAVSASSAQAAAPQPAPQQPSSQQPLPQQPVLAPIVSAPEVLATLPNGTVLSGTVVAAQQSAALQILTKYGTIELAANLALPAGARVALQIRGAGQVHLQIVGSQHAAGQLQGPAKPSADTPVRLTSQILTATLESSALSQLTGRAGSAQSATPGTAYPSAVASNAVAQLPQVLRQLSAGAQFQVQVTPLVTGTSGAPASTGSNAPLFPTTVPQGPPSMAAAATNPQLAGSVIASGAQTSGAPGSGATGRTVLQTSLGILSLNETLQLPAGAKVQIQVIAKSLPQALPAAATSDALLPAGNSGLGWPSLEAIAQRAGEGQVSSALAAQVLRRVPAAGPNLSSNILFLLAALGAGQLSGWLGRPTLDQLQREGHGDLTTRLDNDLAQAGRISDINSGEWRALILPFLDDGQLRQLRLFLRRRNEDAEQEGKDGAGSDATRFLLEIELSKLGDLQADGLIRSKLFDLILRTRRPFSRPMREEIIRIFTESNHSLGLAGQILFEASDDWLPAAAQAGGLQASPDLMI